MNMTAVYSSRFIACSFQSKGDSDEDFNGADFDDDTVNDDKDDDFDDDDKDFVKLCVGSKTGRGRGWWRVVLWWTSTFLTKTGATALLPYPQP